MLWHGHPYCVVAFQSLFLFLFFCIKWRLFDSAAIQMRHFESGFLFACDLGLNHPSDNCCWPQKPFHRMLLVVTVLQLDNMLFHKAQLICNGFGSTAKMWRFDLAFRPKKHLQNPWRPEVLHLKDPKDEL